MDQAHPAHDVLYAALLDGLPADVVVAHLHGVDDVANRHVEGGKLVGVDVYLVLPDEAADGRDLGHAGHRVQLIAHKPVLNRPQCSEVLSLAFQRVPEDLPDRRGVGAEDRSHALGEERRDQVHPLQDPRPREVQVGPVLEDDVDHREPERRRGTNRLDAGETLEVDDHRIGHLVFNLLRRAPRPVGEHDDLGLGEVRDCVDRVRSNRVDPDRGEQDREAQDQESVLEREIDQSRDHRGLPGVGWALSSFAPLHCAAAPPESWA